MKVSKEKALWESQRKFTWKILPMGVMLLI